MKKCTVCGAGLRPRKRFCDNCGAPTDIQQQEMSTPPAAPASANQPGEQAEEGQKVKGKKPNPAYLAGLVPPATLLAVEGEHLIAPHTPASPHTPGLGAGQVAHPTVPHTPGLGAGQVVHPTVPHTPGLGAGQVTHPQPPMQSLHSAVSPQPTYQPPVQSSYPSTPAQPTYQPPVQSSYSSASSQPAYTQSPTPPSHASIPTSPHSSLVQHVGHAAAGAAKVTSTIAVKIVIIVVITVTVAAAGTAGILISRSHTSGVNGAPADDASFRVNASIQGQYDGGYGPFENTATLVVRGGKVCQSTDTGQTQHSSGFLAGSQVPYTQDVILSCSGTYQGGHITYTETLTSAAITMTDQGSQYTCNLLTPGPLEQLSGSYTTQGNFSGTVTVSSFPQSAFSCPPNATYFIIGGSGTWNGSITS